MATKLPNECLLEIFKYIEEKSLYSVLLVNKTWCRMSVPILWKKPFNEYHSTKMESFKVIIPLISYIDKETRNSLKIDENISKDYFIQEKPTFNYASFIKELDYTNMCHQAITCLKKLRSSQKNWSIMNDNYLYHFEMMQIFEQNSYHVIKHEIENMLNVKNIIKQEDSNKFIESIYKIILNNSRIESLIVDIFYWRSKDIFNILSNLPERLENGFTGFFLKKVQCKLLVKDIDIIINLLKLSNNQIRDLSLSFYGVYNNYIDDSDNNSYLDLINLFKSLNYLEKLHVNYNSYFTKLILSELQNNFHSILNLNLLSHNNMDNSSSLYFLDDEWSNSLELTFNDLKNVDKLEDIPLLNLKFLKLDWDTFNLNHLQSQENDLHQSIISLIQYHNIDLKHINLNPLLEFHFKDIFKLV
jgi:hypothetical protein